jgi:hypothetical protein
MHCSGNADEIVGHAFCVCVACGKRVHGGQVGFWTDFEDEVPVKLRTPRSSSTAHCPKCTKEAVISSKSGLPILDPIFVTEMTAYVRDMGYVENQ